MEENEREIVETINKLSSLIRYIIQKNLHMKANVDPEDIEQEVKIKIWKLIIKGKKAAKLPCYIKKVAYTVTMDELRKLRKHAPPSEPNELKNLYLIYNSVTHGNKKSSPEAIIIKKELKSFLTEAVNSLSENRKQVLRLHLKGMSVEEIGKYFEWDKVKVRHFLYRGIDDLKKKLGEKRLLNDETRFAQKKTLKSENLRATPRR